MSKGKYGGRVNVLKIRIANLLLNLIRLKNGMFSIVTKTWNSVSGYLHNCIYCATSDTLVLTSDLIWKPIRDLQIGDEIVGFSEESVNSYRYLTKTKASNVVRRIKKRKVLFQLEEEMELYV